MAELSGEYMHLSGYAPWMDTLASVYEPTSEWLTWYAAHVSQIKCTVPGAFMPASSPAAGPPSKWSKRASAICLLVAKRSGVREPTGEGFRLVFHTLAICGSTSKWPSRVKRTRPCWMTRAAIQRSLVGMGVPAR